MMKLKRSKPVIYLIFSCFFLTGFKQYVPKANADIKNQGVEGQKRQQKLDLSVPERGIGFQNLPDVLATAQTALPGVNINRKSKDRPVELQGQVIQVQEQEAGKIRSADGAGIVIKFRH